MSVQDILQHAIEKNPLAMKEALEAEMQERVRLAIEEKMAAALEEAADDDDDDDEDEDESDDDDDDEDEMDESVDLEEQTMTVDIDHMGGRDAMAKKHNITLKKTGDYSHDATGKKKDLQKYLVHHYDGDHEEAKGNHPEVFK